MDNNSFIGNTMTTEYEKQLEARCERLEAELEAANITLAKMAVIDQTRHTPRGFASHEFKDAYDIKCSIQKSSSAERNCIWLGVDDPAPVIMASKAAQYGIYTTATCGWIPFQIPDDVLIHSRMHLTQEHVENLLPLLQHFADTGRLPR